MFLPTKDSRLIAALETGLPDCSGIALGLDRLLMMLTGAQSLADVLPFPIDRA
jgi:lysyl-tRNA synthetase class 2